MYQLGGDMELVALPAILFSVALIGMAFLLFGD